MARDGKEYPNSGILFRNNRKNDNPKAPDYTGTASVESVDVQTGETTTLELRLSAWIKEGKNGKFMSISFKPKDDDYRRGQGHVREDDDIPF